MENKKTSLLDNTIDFFATIYDLVIELFANIYDWTHDSIFFLVEYVKWITNINSSKTNDFSTLTEKTIPIHNQSPFEIR